MARRPPLTLRVSAGTLLFLGWLWGGYTALLAAVGGMSFAAAVWQAALCLLAIPVLLFAVVTLVALPKPLSRWLPRPVIEVLWALGGVSEVLLPWLGWSTLLWVLHGGRWTAALWPGAAIAAFSYITGLAVLLLFRPGPRSVRVTELTLILPRLPAAFDGYRILHVSDLHVSSFNRPARARARLAAAAGTEADLVAFTGDLTDSPSRLDAAAEIIAGLSGRDGIVAVMGNHDNWLGPARVCEALRRHAVLPLINERRTLTRREAVLHLAGVDNAAYGERDDLRAALAGTGEKDAVIVLAHAPDLVLRPEAARADLLLCGHTHGGQIVLPLLGPFYVPSKVGRRYPSGLFRHGDGWLFVTRGLGEIFPPLRVLCPPEVAVITLRCPS